MRAERLGSYSIRSTVAVNGLSPPPPSPLASFLLQKSTTRYTFLCPPPRWRTLILPSAPRPPDLRRPTVSRLWGLPFHRPVREVTTRPRKPGVVGR